MEGYVMWPSQMLGRNHPTQTKPGPGGMTNETKPRCNPSLLLMRIKQKKHAVSTPPPPIPKSFCWYPCDVRFSPCDDSSPSVHDMMLLLLFLRVSFPSHSSSRISESASVLKLFVFSASARPSRGRVKTRRIRRAAVRSKSREAADMTPKHSNSLNSICQKSGREKQQIQPPLRPIAANHATSAKTPPCRPTAKRNPYR